MNVSRWRRAVSIVALGLSLPAGAASAEELNVYAAASLTDVMPEPGL